MSYYSKHKFSVPTATALAALVALTVTSCASGPRENLEITRLESTLRAAYNDQYVANYGRAELEKAENTLDMARTDWSKRRMPNLDHHLELTEAYLLHAQTRGKQEEVKTDINNLRTRQDELRIAARDGAVRRAENQAANYRSEAELASQAAQSAELAATTAQQQAAVAQDQASAANRELMIVRDQMKEFEFQITNLGGSLVLRDVMFEVNSAQLRPGAEQRLQPLVNYLRGMPNANIRIEGHTDSTGGLEYNNRLSTDRAQSIANALVAQGVAASRIQTAGFGPSKPIASNNTVSGREQNRRVEITLLN